MPETTIIVQHSQGLHARPASKFVTEAQKYDADISVKNGTRSANAKSMLGILTLDVNKGTEITIHAEGEDAGEAISALEQLIIRNFED
ncbi:MAG: HPr family phosphocarrier protein [Anaerolineales bacterium]|nr:HPr family phosphocarrier protein [Anaerolineales bacterium]MCA9928496.1 HPr family phosphocarrier protein [Anaerolineales bacterium]